MIRSMTGYGRGEAEYAYGRIVIELKAVNHRFFEFVPRLPRRLAPLEDRIRSFLSERVSRGRLEVYLEDRQTVARPRSLSVDKNLALAYYNGLKEINEAIGSNSLITASDLAQFPEIFILEEKDLDVEETWPAVEKALEDAYGGFDAMRLREGKALAADLLERAAKIEESLSVIAGRAGSIPEEYRERLEARLADLVPGGIDESRLAAEVAIMADRSDITEEMVRLRSHLSQARSSLKEGGIVGRKIDFIFQEILREANTIGSKAGDYAVGQAVVEIKTELEKMREQVQNIE